MGQILDMFWRDKRISGQLGGESRNKESRIVSGLFWKDGVVIY